ncbi:MAG: 4Fe-4S binding protein [Actinobacteria bacterium]|nr:4Fe-4S binding protein [Actinomycetota bacterium]MBU1943914.1 4Fe-4S binding protein [Actinomycetota bacterium]MBU2688564.1 4Fe-4S binding protein [Actinomycetota bacterium]
MADEERYVKLAEKIFMGESPVIRQLFAAIAGPEEAEALLAMPATTASLAEGSGRSVEETQSMVDGLYRKGLVFKKETPEGTVYRMCRDIMQFHDATILWPEAPRSYLDLWQRYMEEEWPAFSETVEKMLPRPVTRIVPVSESVDSRQQVLAFEDVRRIVENSEPIAVTNCTCRLIAHKCDRPVEICLQVGKAAAYSVDRGTGRAVDTEEAIALLRKAEEAGLVHVTMNRAGESHFICNCCNDCCMTFPMLIDRKLKMCDPSRFGCVIDEETCTGCGDCLERCFFGALTLDESRGLMTVDAEACMGCGLCQVVCPEGAVSLVEVREQDFIPG